MQWMDAYSSQTSRHHDAAMLVLGVITGAQFVREGKCGARTQRDMCDVLWEYRQREAESVIAKKAARKKFAHSDEAGSGLERADEIVVRAARVWCRDMFGTHGGERRPSAGKLHKPRLRSLVAEFHARREIEAQYKIPRYGSEPEKERACYSYWHVQIKEAGGGKEDGLLKEKNVLRMLPELKRGARVRINVATATTILARHGMKGERYLLPGPIDYDVLMIAIKLWSKRKQWVGWGGPSITFSESGKAKVSSYKDTGHFSWWIEAVTTEIETMLARGEALHEEAEKIKADHAALMASDEAQLPPAVLATRQRLNTHNDVRNALFKARAELERAQAELERAQAEWDGMNASKGARPNEWSHEHHPELAGMK